jgi:LPXTG-motif cell wall-anchored protein
LGGIASDTGGHTVNNMVYIGFSLIGFGLAFFLYLILIDRPEQEEDDELN